LDEFAGRLDTSRDEEGRTALHWAAANGKSTVVAKLLERGADIHAKCKHAEQSPLHFASR